MCGFFVFPLTHRAKKKAMVGDTPTSEVVQRLSTRNADPEARLLELEGRQNTMKRRKRDGGAVKPPTGEAVVSKRVAARQREAAANAEISRLKQELATLKAEGCSGYLAQEKAREGGGSILPRRALTLSGFWNVLPNDLLEVTPILIEAVKAKGGSVIRREGLQTCFRGNDRRLVVEAVLEVMALRFPQYQRRVEEV
jgi:hypothetical protein